MIVVAGIPLLTLATLTIQHALNVTQLLSDLTRKAAGYDQNIYQMGQREREMSNVRMRRRVHYEQPTSQACLLGLEMSNIFHNPRHI